MIRVLISRDQLEQANTLISGQSKSEFAANYDELLGDIKSRQGNIDAARAAYQQAINKLRADGRDVATIELKLNNIGQP